MRLALPILLLAPLCTTPVVSADDAPARSEAADPQAARAAVNEALDALRAEVAAMKTPADLRGESDYFTTDGKELAEAVTPAIVVEALGAQLAPAPAVDAYLKWQLLSAVPGKFEGELEPAAVRAYENAPRPLPKPGIDPQERRALRQAELNGLREGQVDDADARFKAFSDRQTQGNDQILAYRTELYGKLPVSGPSLAAAMNDVVQRVEAGINSHGMSRQVIGDAQTWAVAADRNDVMRVASLMRELDGYEAPQHITGVKFEGSAQFDLQRAYAAEKNAYLQAADTIVGLANSTDTGAGGLRLK